jgi:hypothetical protein
LAQFALHFGADSGYNLCIDRNLLARQDHRMTVQELENAIRQLSQDEFAQLARWIDEFRADQWDRQIEADIRAGRLDEAGRRADADFDAGRCAPL